MGSTLRPLTGAEMPTAADVLAVMKKVADWQLAHPGKQKPTDWVPAVGYTGIMALYDVSKDPKYLDAMVTMAEKNEWKPGPRPYHADDFAVCQTYAEIYAIKKDPRMIEPTVKALDHIIDTLPEAGTPDQLFSVKVQKRWTWCDALFMAPPAWARISAATGDKKYIDFIDKEWWVTYGALYSPADHLFFRDTSYFDKRTPSGRKVFWARGNGWVYAGLTRLLDYLPKDDPDRAKYIQVFREMTDSVLKAQAADGLWRPSLLDPDQIPSGEASGTGLFLCGLQWGVNHGILDQTKVGDAIAQGWIALAGCVQPDGMLGYVQPVGSAPKPFKASSTVAYGTGAFLLAGRKIYLGLKRP